MVLKLIALQLLARVEADWREARECFVVGVEGESLFHLVEVVLQEDGTM